MNPCATRTDLIVKHIDDETLIYNLKTHKAICLNETAAAVYEACDGAKDVADLAEALNLGETDVARTLRHLAKQGLLEDGFEAPTILSRRDAFTTLAKGTAAVAPVVMAISVPTAAQAMSCLPDGSLTVSSTECCSMISYFINFPSSPAQACGSPPV